MISQSQEFGKAIRADLVTYARLIFLTRFVKRGLPHTSYLPTLTIHNVRFVNATDLKFGQQEAET